MTKEQAQAKADRATAALGKPHYPAWDQIEQAWIVVDDSDLAENI